MTSKIPKVRFNNGREFPIFGLRTYRPHANEIEEAVKYAINIGYRHIDTALINQNEKEVGAGIAAKIKEGVVKREEIFVTSKLWNTHHQPSAVERALKLSLDNLGLEYLDLYLVHWPFAFKDGDDLSPLNKDGITNVFSDVDIVDTWKAMEEVYGKGLVKNIGISNFNKKQIERLLEHATVKPVTNQVEIHPYLNQKKLLEFCQSKGITLTAYFPFGSPSRPSASSNKPNLLDDKRLKPLAQKHNKTPAQILLRYEVQRGIITIPKSVTKSHIKQNFEIFDFELTRDDMNALDAFDCNYRICRFQSSAKHKDYPFNDEY